MDEEYGCSVENFIKFEESEECNYSICREERQYAVFLYNILRKYCNADDRCDEDVKKIFDVCNIPKTATIQSVFYEATFMRDFFERDRRLAEQKRRSDNGSRHDKIEDILLSKKYSKSKKKAKTGRFNQKLINYVEEGIENPYGDDVHLGSVKSEDESWRKIKCMMNAKPDIAVIYKDNEGKKLLFLECKFESYERKDQRKEQWMIADFLCKTYLKGKIKVSEKMKEKVSEKKEENKSCLVQFTREKEKEKCIDIGTLIKLNDAIFPKPEI